MVCTTREIAQRQERAQDGAENINKNICRQSMTRWPVKCAAQREAASLTELNGEMAAPSSAAVT